MHIGGCGSTIETGKYASVVEYIYKRAINRRRGYEVYCFASSGPNWKDGVIFHNQPFMPEHAVYVQQKYDQGQIILAGPYMDLTGGAIVIDVESEEEVISFVENDPTVKNNIFSYQIKAWGDGLSKFEGINPKFGQEYIDYKHKIQKDFGDYLKNDP